ncbi:MAG: heme peroxidase family protein, partial [Actinomycetota bacterium]|nr:heme peroxidase family protein [Actinomycetota bacterium]
ANLPLSSLGRGRYGRMFRNLRPFSPTDESLRALADSMGPYPIPAISASTAPPAAAAAIQPGENPDLAAGYTYLGQFIDHDITFDPVSSLERRNDPDALVSFRTPRFDLDSLYGSGPADSPWLYDQEDPAKLLVGHNGGPDDEAEDLPRNQQGRALVGDPRNDVHVIISQLTLAFIRFHNAVVDHLRGQFVADAELFDEAQRLARWHYQWVVIEDYVRPLVGPESVDRVLVTDSSTGARRADLRFFHWKQEPFMPVEFSAAAFRFGHSQVRATYILNASLDPKHIFLPSFDPAPLEHLGGFRRLPRGWKIDWDLFFAVDGSSPQLSRRIDTKVTGPIAQLPPVLDRTRRPLALLDLLRGKALGLPSGEAVAGAMGTAPVGAPVSQATRTPLWYYLLREAETTTEGRRLGPTAATIVAEVFVGLLVGDPASFLRMAPTWEPTLPSAEPGRFTIVDLLRFAGVA